jgi:hypothetical protein
MVVNPAILLYDARTCAHNRQRDVAKSTRRAGDMV